MDSVPQAPQPPQNQPQQATVENPPANTTPQQKKPSVLLAILITAFVSAAIFGGIGYALGTNTAYQPKPTPTTAQPSMPVTTGVSPVATVTPTAHLSGTSLTSPTSEFGDEMPITKGQVMVKIDKVSYVKGEENIRVTITNGLEQIIYAQDEQTNCTIATLERKNNDSWEPVSDCALGRVPYVVATGVGRGRTFELYTIPTPPLPPNDPYHMKPGTYRLSFSYGVTVEGPAPVGNIVDPKTVYSNVFTIIE